MVIIAGNCTGGTTQIRISINYEYELDYTNWSVFVWVQYRGRGNTSDHYKRFSSGDSTSVSGLGTYPHYISCSCGHRSGHCRDSYRWVLCKKNMPVFGIFISYADCYLLPALYSFHQYGETHEYSRLVWGR